VRKWKGRTEMRLSWSRVYLSFFIASPFIGALRVVSGYELPQLVYDVLLVGFGLLSLIGFMRGHWRWPDLLVVALLCVGVAQLLNPYEHNAVLKVYGFRTLLLYCLAYFIGRRVSLTSEFRENFYRAVWLLAIANAVYATRQWLFP